MTFFRLEGIVAGQQVEAFIDATRQEVAKVEARRRTTEGWGDVRLFKVAWGVENHQRREWLQALTTGLVSPDWRAIEASRGAAHGATERWAAYSPWRGAPPETRIIWDYRPIPFGPARRAMDGTLFRPRLRENGNLRIVFTEEGE